MSYESKLFIVEKCSHEDEVGRTYAQIIAMFDMCKFYNMTTVFEKKTNCYFYDLDGNTKILEDKYGDSLKEASVEDVIHVLENEIKHGEHYRRIFPLLSALKTIHDQQSRGVWKNIVVLHYGY